MVWKQPQGVWVSTEQQSGFATDDRAVNGCLVLRLLGCFAPRSCAVSQLFAVQHDLMGTQHWSEDGSAWVFAPNHLPTSDTTWLAVQQHEFGPQNRATLIDKAINVRNITNLSMELYDPWSAASRPIFTDF